MTLRSLLASAALLFAAAAPALAEGWELGVGVQGGWATLEEAGSGGFAVDEQPGYGLALGVSRRLSAATSVELEVLAGRHGTTLPDINAAWSSGALGLGMSRPVALCAGIVTGLASIIAFPDNLDKLDSLASAGAFFILFATAGYIRAKI